MPRLPQKVSPQNVLNTLKANDTAVDNQDSTVETPDSTPTVAMED